MFPDHYPPFDAKTQGAISSLSLHAEMTFDATLIIGATTTTYHADFTADFDFPRIPFDSRYILGVSNNIPFDDNEKFILARYPYYKCLNPASFAAEMPGNASSIIGGNAVPTNGFQFVKLFAGAFSDSKVTTPAPIPPDEDCDTSGRNLTVAATLNVSGASLSTGMADAVWSFTATKSGGATCTSGISALGALYGGDTDSFDLGTITYADLLGGHTKVITVANPSGAYDTWDATATYSMTGS